MTANIRKGNSGRWYFISSRTGDVSASNWRSRNEAVAAAKADGHSIILGDR